MTTTTRVLMVLTSHARMGDTGKPTGVWIEEFTTPYYYFVDQGAQVELASIAGGAVPVDPQSLAQPETAASVRRYQADAALQAALAGTRAVADVSGGDYDVVFMPGGHGTMWDLPASPALAWLVSRTFQRGAVVAAVCHGPAGLVTATDANGRPIVAGRRVTCFTNSEEAAVGLTDAVPFLLETRLGELGARFEGAPDFKAHAIADGNVVTGQNPASSALAAELALTYARTRRAAA